MINSTLGTSKNIGIVIPVFNDWAALDLLIAGLNRQAERTKLNLQIFVIDDGSPELPEHRFFLGAKALVDLQLVRLSHNIGHQSAIAVGLVVASRVKDLDAVVVMDADGEDQPEDVPRLLSAWGGDANLIVVAQRNERSEGLIFRFFYALYKRSFVILTGRKIDFGNFCLLPRAALCRLTYDPSIWNSLAAAITRTPIPRVALPVARGVRLAGKSQMNFQSLLLHGVSAIAVYSDYVLVRILVSSALLAGLAIIAISVVMGIRLATTWAIPGWASFLAASFVIIFLQALLMSGIALFQLMSFRNVKTSIPAVDATSLVVEIRTIELPRVNEIAS